MHEKLSDHDKKKMNALRDTLMSWDNDRPVGRYLILNRILHMGAKFLKCNN